MLTSYTLDGLIHLLLVIAVIAVISRTISGRRVFSHLTYDNDCCDEANIKLESE